MKEIRRETDSESVRNIRWGVDPVEDTEDRAEGWMEGCGKERRGGSSNGSSLVVVFHPGGDRGSPPGANLSEC